MKLYGINDMARVDCGGCTGCSACCQEMGDTIILDPLDIWRLTKRMNQSFEGLLERYIGLHVEEGVILPHLLMAEKSGRCVFLSGEGRCSIHDARPGLCRIFPLGRSYEEGDLQYFLLEECPRKNKLKVKIRKWLDTPEPEKNRHFLTVWHDFRKKLQEKAAAEPENSREINLFALTLFFVQPYDTKADFYSQFAERYTEACAHLRFQMRNVP